MFASQTNSISFATFEAACWSLYYVTGPVLAILSHDIMLQSVAASLLKILSHCVSVSMAAKDLTAVYNRRYEYILT